MSLEFRIWKQICLRQLSLGTCIVCVCVCEELLLSRGVWNNHPEICKPKQERVPGKETDGWSIWQKTGRNIWKCIFCRAEREAGFWKFSWCKPCEFQLYSATALNYLASWFILKILHVNTSLPLWIVKTNVCSPKKIQYLTRHSCELFAGTSAYFLLNLSKSSCVAVTREFYCLLLLIWVLVVHRPMPLCLSLHLPVNFLRVHQTIVTLHICEVPLEHVLKNYLPASFLWSLNLLCANVLSSEKFHSVRITPCEELE